MTNIIIFTQNVKLNSFAETSQIAEANCNVFLTPHKLFENEVQFLRSVFHNCVFYSFGDLLTDFQAEDCDLSAFDLTISLSEYYENIKQKKNKYLFDIITNKYPDYRGYLCSNDLGVCELIWTRNGFQPVVLDYYFEREVVGFAKEVKHSKIKQLLKCIPGVMALKKRKILFDKRAKLSDNVYSMKFDKKKYVFIGKLSRVSYRTDVVWEKSKEDYDKLKKGIYETKDKCIYLSSLHEYWKAPIPESNKYELNIIQDGYLPPNYTSKYLCYKQGNAKYYVWDILGREIFNNHKVPVSIMPFRKKLYLPQPEFKDKITTILVATSGPGDWTAMKNRSDEDLMLIAFVDIAKRFPNIRIIYRCHPTWIHPDHNGINSIKRAADYIAFTNLSNIKISGNIPQSKDGQSFSFSRNSFDEDLKDADIVFGEHSVSMIDGGFKGIPFCSVNLTGRRDLFCGVTKLGFPHCETVEEIISIITSYSDEYFQTKYKKAIELYNAMTDAED